MTKSLLFRTILVVTILFPGLCLQAWNTPTLSSPSSGSSVYAGVTLDWGAVSSSSGYQLQIDTSASFNSPVRFQKFETYINTSSSNSDTEEQLDNLFFGKTYYWRVRAFISGDTSAWTTTWTFSTRDYVSLESPASGSSVYAGYTLEWYPHTGVDFYDFEADTSATFNSPAKKSATKAYINSSNGNSDTYHFLDDLYFGKTYYWRVRARNAVDTTAWSSVWTINTRDYVSLESPASGSSVYAGYTLEWYPHTGVDFYDFEADTSATFNSPAKKSATKAYINSSNGNSDTYHFLDDLYFGKTYYWRVRARNAVDTTAWSSVWTINTRDYVSLESPASGSSVYAGYTMEWYPHTGVDFYDFEADTSAAFNSPAKKSATKAYINSSNGNSDTYHFLDDLYFGKTYYWRVRARNAVDTTAWSSVWTINTRDYVSLESPASGSSVYAGYTMEWYPHTGVDFYDFEADTSAAFNSPAKKSATKAYINSSNGNSDTYHFLDDLYFGKTYYWRVRARNAVDTTAWGTVWTFNTINNVNLTSPSTWTTQWTGLTLDWAPHTGVDYYDLEADTSNLFNSPARKSATKTYINSSNGNSDTYHWLDDLYFGKEYYWHVRVRNAVDTSMYSTTWNFTTANYVTLSSPGDGATGISTSGTTLDWAPHAGIDIYQLQIDTTNLFNSITMVTLDKAYINSSNGNNDTYQSTGPLLTNQIYFWRVRAINAVDTSGWTVRSFNTGTGTIQIPAVPTLISPSNNSTGVAASLTLDWNNATNASSYEYEYADNSSFYGSSTGISNNSEILISGLNPNNTTYYWRVRSKNGSNIYSDYSAQWKFTTGCSVTAPVIDEAGLICDSGSVILHATGGSIIHWYDSPSGGTLLFTGTDFTTPVLHIQTSYYATSDNGTCESERTPVAVSISTSPAKPIIFQSSNTLYTNAANSYQWYLSGILVDGAQSQFFSPLVNGTYTVVISNSDGCTSESEPFIYITESIPESTSDIKPDVYPNPGTGLFQLKGINGQYTISDLLGNIILTSDSKILNLTHFPDGVYFLKYRGNCIKIIKQ